MHTPHFSRRTFLHTVLASSIAPALVRGRGLNEKLDVAFIGVGNRGKGDLAEIARLDENVVALCDVNSENLKSAYAKHPGSQMFVDYRKMFDEMKGIDAVVVATPEHHHAFCIMPALKMKKHVFCEKPLTHGIWEARMVREATREAKVATQMGTQMHASANFRRTVELVRSGVVGPISEVHVWVSRAWGWQSEAAAKANKDIVWATERPKEAQTPPAFLDWDQWVGPAPERPYNEVYFPGPKWYRWWDFGSGTMSDLGSHWNDLPFWALDLDAPTTIEASGPPPHPEIAPASMSATYQYPARGKRAALKLTWHQGESKPAIWKDEKIPQWPNGVLFIGDKGMILADYGKNILLPEAKFADFVRPAPTIPDSIGHHAEWVRACKTGEPTTCNFDYSGALTEANHLGNVAYRLGKKITWDAKKLEVVGVPEAKRLVRREYRKGWTLV
ncbi:MAG: Gfo/Idh/MocA family oxidoreductase [Chthoniobacteraceae bacterium]